MGDPLPHPTPSPALAGRGAQGRKRPGVVTQTLVPLDFSAVVATPLLIEVVHCGDRELCVFCCYDLE